MSYRLCIVYLVPGMYLPGTQQGRDVGYDLGFGAVVCVLVVVRCSFRIRSVVRG